MSVSTGTAADSSTQEPALRRLQASIADYAVGGVVGLLTVLIGILVGAKFVSAMPSTQVFGGARDAVVNSAGTMFLLLGIGLLVMGAVAIIRIVRGGFATGR